MAITRHGRSLSAVTLAILVGSAWSVAAAQQDSTAPPRPDRKQVRQNDAKPSDNPLAGPKVEDRQVPGAPSTFGEMTGRPAQGVASRPVPTRQFMQALRSLYTAEDASLRPTPEQEEAVKKIQAAFEADQAAFREEHADEFRALRAEAQKLRENNPAMRPETDRPTDVSPEARRRAANTPEARALREKQQALMAKGPKAEAFHAQMWEVLTEPQQDHVRLTLVEMNERFAQRARNMPIGDRIPGAAPSDRPSDRAGDAMMAPELDAPGADRARRAVLPQGLDPAWAPVLERISKLPPEMQQRLIQAFARTVERAEAAVGEGAPATDRRSDAPRRCAPKPAPSMDSVDVPPPPTGSR